MRHQDNQFGSLLLAFAIGGLVGAAVTLLMAPHTGQETRSLIKDRSVELKDKTVGAVEDTRSRTGKKIETLASQTKEKVASLKRQGREDLEGAKEALHDEIKAAQESISY